MTILKLIALLLLGLGIGWLVGYFLASDPPAAYMEVIPKIEAVARQIPASEGEDRKRLCKEFSQLLDDLANKGGPKSIVDEGRKNLKTFCTE